ncbi:threonine ammonia-lyase [Candidatus Bathyarchaeota archaeon]|nr:threonine ammonia-lyase [Candidatus Bathyarchaeota archaeon]
MEFKDVYLAGRRLQGLVRRTPLEYSPFFSEVCGGEVYLKLENLQLTGAYKVRGALNKMLQLSEEERGRGVVTASSGNHAQGVGYAARMLGVRATVVVPRNTPRTKIEAIKRYGVDLIVHGEIYDEAELKARELERELSKVYISPYNDYDVIAGQGTVGLEMWEEKSDLDVVLVPVGGGGLLSGVAVALKSLNPEVEVLGVQSKASPVMYESFRRGEIVEVPMEESVAEALHGGIEKGSVTFEIVRELVDDILLVEEGEIRRAIALFLEHHHQVAEGAGAVGLAALMTYGERFKGRRVGVVISGGNIDISLLREILLEDR